MQWQMICFQMSENELGGILALRQGRLEAAVFFSDHLSTPIFGGMQVHEHCISGHDKALSTTLAIRLDEFAAKKMARQVDLQGSKGRPAL